MWVCVCYSTSIIYLRVFCVCVYVCMCVCACMCVCDESLVVISPADVDFKLKMTPGFVLDGYCVSMRPFNITLLSQPRLMRRKS